MQKSDATNKTLQHSKLELKTAVLCLSSLKSFISAKRDSFKYYEEEGKKLTGTADFIQMNTRQKRHNVHLNPLDYCHTEPAVLSPSEKFKRSCLTSYNILMSHL